MLTKRVEKKIDRNCTQMLQVILSKSWKQHPTQEQLYGHLPSISKNIQIRQVIHGWRSKNEFVSNILLWTPSHWRASVGQPTRTYLQLLCMDRGCSLEDLPEAIKDRDKWWERESGKSVLAAWHDDDNIYIFFQPDRQDVKQSQFLSRINLVLNNVSFS